MYCLGVCGKILASGSQSEAIRGYVFATGPQSISIFTVCGNITYLTPGPQHQLLSLKVGADLW